MYNANNANNLEITRKEYKGVIISAFPGTGKSHCFRMSDELETSMSDSDSSEFSWSSPGVRHPDFPNNYITHIQQMRVENDFVFVSSHKVVRDALAAHGMEYFLVYPSTECKPEYMQRYADRGNDAGFIGMMDKNFEKFITECEEQASCMKVKLKPGQYVSDLVLALSHGYLAGIEGITKMEMSGDAINCDVEFTALPSISKLTLSERDQDLLIKSTENPPAPSETFKKDVKCMKEYGYIEISVVATDTPDSHKLGTGDAT